MSALLTLIVCLLPRSATVLKRKLLDKNADEVALVAGLFLWVISPMNIRQLIAPQMEIKSI